MTKILFALLVTTILIASCNNEPKNLDEFMVDISEFQIDTTVLKDGDYVRILGSSGNLTEEHSIDFYTLIVVQSLESGDTINVLMTNFYQTDLNDTETRFMSNSSMMGRIVERNNHPDVFDGKKLEDVSPLKYDKVFYDQEYIQVDVRNYPAITGNLGDWVIEGNLDDIEG